jgi:hypothetical protein
MYILAKINAPGAQEERLTGYAEDAVKDALKKMNNFFETNWKMYRQQVEATPMKLFKD